MEINYIVIFAVIIIFALLMINYGNMEYYEDRYDYRFSCPCCGRYNCRCPRMNLYK